MRSDVSLTSDERAALREHLASIDALFAWVTFDVEATVDAYLHCAAWASDPENRASGSGREYCPDDFTRAARASATRDVHGFLSRVGYVPVEAYKPRGHDLSWDRGRFHKYLGYDLWLTRNGHGAGFWDGDWEEPYASLLSYVANQLGEVEVEEVGNGRHIRFWPE